MEKTIYKKKFNEEDLKEDKYHKSELSRLLPLDQYGIRVQLSSGSGKTKYLNLNRELVVELQKFINENEDSALGIFF